jgi:hypothetical protein
MFSHGGGDPSGHVRLHLLHCVCNLSDLQSFTMVSTCILQCAAAAECKLWTTSNAIAGPASGLPVTTADLEGKWVHRLSSSLDLF